MDSSYLTRQTKDELKSILIGHNLFQPTHQKSCVIAIDGVERSMNICFYKCIFHYFPTMQLFNAKEAKDSMKVVTDHLTGLATN